MDRRAAPVELFFDLVFVFAITQVTQLLSDDLTWAGFGRGMLVLAMMWWAWSAFTWVANAHDPDHSHVRAALFTAMIAAFIAALTVPRAYGEDSTTFAVAYVVLRLVHVGLYWDASRRGNASWEAIAGFALTTVVGLALIVAGSFAEGEIRIVLWVLAVAIDFAGPWVTRRRLRGLQQVGVTHFAERFGLFIIICLGESIIAIGIGAAGADFDFALGLGLALGLLIAVTMWWTYFDYVAEAAEEQLRSMADAVSAARDAYSYLHFLMVAGIVTAAVGGKKMAGHVEDPLSTGGRLALCGGVALYLAGHIGFRLRMVGTLSSEKSVALVAVVVVFAATADAAAYVVAGALVVVLAALVMRESAVESDLRARLHHHPPEAPLGEAAGR